MAQSDQFNGRLGLIFASIGAAIGTGNIWRFPRMVGANGGGTFLIPWLIFLFAWSIPLVIAEFAMGKRSRTGTIGTFRIFACLLYTSPSPRDRYGSRMPSSA